jgi:hypothetical protein
VSQKRGKGKAKPVKKWRVAIAAVYSAVLFVCLFNAIAPSSAVPLVSFDYVPTSVYWIVTIPPNASQYLIGVFSETASFNVTVSASQPIADGVPITINVVGCVKPTQNVTYDTFVVGFLGAYDNKNPGSVYNGYTVTALSLLDNATWTYKCPSILGTNAVHFAGETYDTTFYFENPGVYPLSVRATIFPNVFGPPVQYNYTNNVIDVQSSSSINQGVYSKAQTVIIVASSAFLLLELYPDIKKRLSQ